MVSLCSVLESCCDLRHSLYESAHPRTVLRNVALNTRRRVLKRTTANVATLVREHPALCSHALHVQSDADASPDSCCQGTYVNASARPMDHGRAPFPHDCICRIQRSCAPQAPTRNSLEIFIEEHQFSRSTELCIYDRPTPCLLLSCPVCPWPTWRPRPAPLPSFRRRAAGS